MKRPNGTILLWQKISLHKCRASALCTNRSDKGKTRRFMYFRRILVEGWFLLCPLSNVRLFIITVPGISFWVNFKSLNPKSSLFLPPYLLFLKLVALRPIFHAYVVSVFGSRGELKKGVSPTLSVGLFSSQFPLCSTFFRSIARFTRSTHHPKVLAAV